MKLSKKAAAAATALLVCAAMPLGLTTRSFAADTVSGDFNGNGTFELADITGLMKAYVNGSNFDARTLSAADTDGDGKITLTDCKALLKQYVNGGSGPSSEGSATSNIMPVNGEVSHPFSNGELVKSETLGVWKAHDGCDILCKLGTNVKSMSDGVVKKIDNRSTIWGVGVIVEQSNGLEVQYYGLAKKLNVNEGSVVKQGDIIGKTGDTNEAEELQKPHLHLGVQREGKWIDPMSVITK